jgi:hypothetical protein
MWRATEGQLTRTAVVNDSDPTLQVCGGKEAWEGTRKPNAAAVARLSADSQTQGLRAIA